MLLQKEQSLNQIKIQGYKDRKINVSGKYYASPVLLTAYELSLFESVDQFSDLTADNLLLKIPENIEIILVGSGDKHLFFPQKEIKKINELGIAIEVMATRQACHTFQVLTYEKREIVALLFP